MNLTKTLFAAAAMTLIGGAASAASSYNVSSTGNIGTLTCDNCEWLSSSDYQMGDGHPGDGTLSSFETVSLFDIDPNSNSEANEIANLNEILGGGSLDAADFGRQNVSSWDENTSEGWLIFKFGQGTSDGFSHLFVFNYGGNVSYEGGALSHVTYGLCKEGDEKCDPPNEVPLPAAGWLMLAGIGGIAAVRRRRKAA